MVEPLSEVMLTWLRLAWSPAPKVTVKAVMESVPVFVDTLMESRSVIPLSGATVLLPGSVPSAMVVVGVE